MLGSWIFFKRVKAESQAKEDPMASTYFSAFLMTLANPLTIISFAGVFAGFGLGSPSGDYVSIAALTIGVFFGSTLWWVLLTSIVDWLGSKLDLRMYAWINRFSGIAIFAFGLITLMSLL
jgi:threonine/homoserine/homoserine lactone efflux protein